MKVPGKEYKNENIGHRKLRKEVHQRRRTKTVPKNKNNLKSAGFPSITLKAKTFSHSDTIKSRKMVILITEYK
jgi:hypothetical protein